MSRQDLARDWWKRAWRLARTPDSYLADDTVITYPLRYFVLAAMALDTREEIL